ncbi:unnamed protein product [Spirodela intermedia]|uniref:Uncharacterized protein n=1 Tax=Spirodela intermedia TaxID=51605 RepID=A0A7I8I9D2_SPIIN|nr:unnamed protein product [Spirodela intermedia]CAA6654033.1 unnamed protein product [Spirodela intermedia]CAA6674647.1 unnamed protein product [Spirodela intermedia]
MKSTHGGREQRLKWLGPIGHVCTTPFHVTSGQPNHWAELYFCQICIREVLTSS